jgi:hypothetical protein
MIRLALCVSARGIRSIHHVEIGAVIPRVVSGRQVIMTMTRTARNQRFARRWASST